MNKKKKDFSFEKRATDDDDGFEGKLSQKFYNLILKELKMTVLDVGCGTGTLLKKIANKFEIEGLN